MRGCVLVLTLVLTLILVGLLVSRAIHLVSKHLTLVLVLTLMALLAVYGFSKRPPPGGQ